MSGFLAHFYWQKTLAPLNATDVLLSECYPELGLDAKSALHDAAELGMSSYLKLAVKDWTTMTGKSRCLDLRDSKGKKPLTNAISSGHLDCVKLLIEGGAEIEVEDIELAKSKEQTDIAELLMEKKS